MSKHDVEIKRESDSPRSLSCCNGSYYPYGTSLSLEDGLIDELGISALSVGDVVQVTGFAVVTGKSKRRNIDGVDRRFDLQLTTLGVHRDIGDEDEERVKRLYGDD